MLKTPEMTNFNRVVESMRKEVLLRTENLRTSMRVLFLGSETAKKWMKIQQIKDTSIGDREIPRWILWLDKQRTKRKWIKREMELCEITLGARVTISLGLRQLQNQIFIDSLPEHLRDKVMKTRARGQSGLILEEKDARELARLINNAEKERAIKLYEQQQKDLVPIFSVH
jgi:hypothetical protein